jgi:NADH-quinone oxidoreductase subunit L
VAILTGITLLLFVGATGKSAQIPLFTWLPDAMAGPTPVSALIHAATMVTAGIYMIARSNIMYSLAPLTREVVAVIGLATALLAASIALYQNDIKKVLAYSTVSQLGFMFLALGVGAYSTGVFHVMTHAFFKALLFLGAGSVIHAMGGEQDIARMGGLYKKIPVTAITFIIGVLAIIGFPFTSGFVSKDEILVAVYQHNQIYFWLAVLGAFLTALYMLRLMMLTFFGSFRGTSEQWQHVHESPKSMTIPLVVLAVLSIAGGWVQLPHIFGGHPYLNEFLFPLFLNSPQADADNSTLEYSLLAGTILILAIIYFMVKRKYSVSQYSPEYNGYQKWLANKWYVDELYDFLVVRPLQWLNKKVLAFVEQDVIDWIVNGVGKAVQLSSRQVRLLQSGQVGSYVLLMVIGILVFFAIEMLLLRQ